MTSLEDACAAWECGADFLGFVFFEGSKRCAAPAVVQQTAEKLGACARLVGVFVNQPVDFIRRIADDCRLWAVQLHGDEDAAAYAALALPVWRAFRLVAGQPAPPLEGWRAERFVMDAAHGGHYGGTGCTADWHAARRLAESRPLMLAGGLTPDNVAQAVAYVQPLGVDVASGVEKAPGKKDRRAVKEFIAAVRAAERRMDEASDEK